MDVRIAPDADRVGALTAATIGRWLRDGGSLGLAGGSTPRLAYLELRNQHLAWESITLWMSDERWVPTDHEDSNAAMASAALGVTAGLLEVPEVGAGDPAAAASRYDSMLGDRVGDSPDVILLGLGGDGHTASLFPGTEALAARDRRYVANWVEALSAWRLTATFPYLWSAKNLAFVVTGEAKAEVVAEIIGGDSDYPAAVATHGANEVTWFLDEGAAGLL